jgi:hypothetical protein
MRAQVSRPAAPPSRLTKPRRRKQCARAVCRGHSQSSGRRTAELLKAKEAWRLRDGEIILAVGSMADLDAASPPPEPTPMVSHPPTTLTSRPASHHLHHANTGCRELRCVRGRLQPVASQDAFDGVPACWGDMYPPPPHAREEII